MRVYTISYMHLYRISTSVPRHISTLVVNMHEKMRSMLYITKDIWF